MSLTSEATPLISRQINRVYFTNDWKIVCFSLSPERGVSDWCHIYDQVERPLREWTFSYQNQGQTNDILISSPDLNLVKIKGLK